MKSIPKDVIILEIAFVVKDANGKYPIPFFQPDYVARFALPPFDGKAGGIVQRPTFRVCTKSDADYYVSLAHCIKSHTTSSNESWAKVS